jgi:hypothetical protein
VLANVIYDMNLPYVLAHFIGDFLLQNDWQAVGKKKSSLICTMHVLLYMTPFLLTELSWLQLGLIALQHWLQDRSSFVGWWCKTMGSFQTELKQNGLPWGHFIVDQVMHFIWMWLVVNYCC